jgi:hypothetical protein
MAKRYTKRPRKKPQAEAPDYLKGPLRPPIFGSLHRPTSETNLDKQRLQILLERMRGLARFYGIEPSSNCWFWLSVELAKELGWFDEPGKPGPKPGLKTQIWTRDECIKLVTRVAAINAERRRGTEDAVRVLKKRYPEYKTVQGLATRYYEAKRIIEPPSWTLWGELKALYGI